MLMKRKFFSEITKTKMKRIIGGYSGSWCRAKASCSDGTSVTLTCENASAGCVGVDHTQSNSGSGYAYCEENGVIQLAQCSNKFSELVNE